MDTNLAGYDRTKSYEWNYEHVPGPLEVQVPKVAGEWQFCGLPVDSPLGIPAGPLLNGRWILYYASLGFDVLTYKTVRSRARACYELPNLLPVAGEQLQGGEQSVAAQAQMQSSWAVSFGMPSREPGVWRADVGATRHRLPRGKLLSVSVVGTIQEGWSIDDLARDYALCARWAVESGADTVEANFSCPNVATCDGQLYQDARSAGLVAQCVRESIGRVPLILKIGHIPRHEAAEELRDAVAEYIDAWAMVNTVATTVRSTDGTLMFAGQKRGIAGEAIRDVSLSQVSAFARLGPRVIGVGGVATAADVRAHLQAGAHAVHIATAAMVDPLVGVRIRQELAEHPR